MSISYKDSLPNSNLESAITKPISLITITIIFVFSYLR